MHDERSVPQCLYTTTCPKQEKEIKFACVNNMDESIAVVDYQRYLLRKNYQRCEEELLLS